MATLFSREPQPTEIELRLREQDRRAGTLLVEADEQVRNSWQELAFQRAESGEYATQPFTEAFNKARVLLAEAFELRQLLDDHVPDSEAQRDQWTRRIIELAQAAIDTLAAQGEAFGRLRAIGHDVPRQAALVREQCTELARRREAADRILARLTEQFAPGVVAQARDDWDQAGTMLGLAARALEAAERRLGTGVQSVAPETLDAARTALARAGQLLDSLEAREGDLVAAQVNLTQLQAHGEHVLAQAMGQVAADDAAQLAAIGHLSDVLADLGHAPSADPVRDAARLRTALDVAEAPLIAQRTAAERRAAALAALPGHIRQARDFIQWTEDYAASRRATLGSQARTRLAEAMRHTALAEQAAASDPEQAIAMAQRASSLATEAWNIAHADLETDGRGPSARQGARGALGGMSPEGKTAAVAVAAGIGGLLLGSLGGKGFGRGSFDIGDLFD